MFYVGGCYKSLIVLRNVLIRKNILIILYLYDNK